MPQTQAANTDQGGTVNRKHFVVIADRIARNRRAFADQPAALQALECLAQDLAYEFSQFSDTFDRVRFLTACGVPQTPGGDKHGNKVAVEGVTRCPCGAKYWENDRCVSCGAPVAA